MSGTDLRSIVLKAAGGFAVAGVVFVVMFFLVGVDDVVTEFTHAKTPVVGALLIVSVLWLISWSLTLQTVLDSLDIELGLVSSVLMYSSAVFANNITPFGQAGGEPITAGVLSGTLDTEYETGLAAIASVDTINFFPSITFAFLGLGYYASQATFDERLEFATGGFAVICISVFGGLLVAWSYRGQLVEFSVPRATIVLQHIGRLVPFVSPPTEAEMRRRATTFVDSIETVGSDGGSLRFALAASAVGWLLQMAALWLSFYAIGVSIPVYIPLFALPLAMTASMTPLPGGTGGIETVLIAVVMAAKVADPAAATAAVVLFRGGIYWFQLLIGGFSVGVLTGWQFNG